MHMVSKKAALPVVVRLLTILVPDIGTRNLLPAEEQVPIPALLKHGRHGSVQV